MGAVHTHELYVHGHSRVHRLPPHVKIAATFAFAVGVALTDPRAVAVFAVDAVVLAVVVAVAALPVRFVAARMLVITPFVLAALVIPLVADDAGAGTVAVLGREVAVDGLVGAWNIIAKASLGVVASIVLAATTPTPQLLRGLDRLRVPAVLTQIAGFMVRYLEVIAGELRRQRIAMVARGHDPRWLWQVKPLTASVGSLFVRSYERGERVHAAMLARGYDGTMPALDEPTVPAGDWVVAALPPLVALGGALLSRTVL